MAAAAVAVVAAVAVAATTTAAPVVRAAPGASAARAASSANAALPNLAYARARVARYRRVPQWIAPGPAINARKARGKSVFIIPITSALPYQQLLDAGLDAAAKAAGLEVTHLPNEGQPSQWARGVERAIAERADLIALIGAPDPRVIRGPLRKARKAGIPVVVGSLVDEGTPRFANVTARMDVAARSLQRLAADYEIAYSRGKANTLIVTSNEATQSDGLVAAIQDEYATVCGPGCTTTVVNVPLAQWSTRLRGAVEAALDADPAITFVHPVYDGMTPFAIAGIKAAGAQRRVRIGTVDGSDFVLKLIREQADGGLVLFDVGTSLDWQGWANVDVILRVLLGQPVPRTQNLPRRIFDRANVAEAGTPPSPGKGYGEAYKQGYRRLWGLAK